MKLSEDKRIISYTITADDENKRLDVVARKAFHFLPLSIVFKSIRTGRITINKQKTSSNYRLKIEDSLSYEHPSSLNIFYPNLLTNANKQNHPIVWSQQQVALYKTLTILWENEHFVIVNKPVHWISHGNTPSLNEWLLWSYGENQSISFNKSPTHRLDVGTSGLVVLAKTLIGARTFTHLQQHNHLEKIYVSIVEGRIYKPILSELYLERKNKKTYVHKQANTNTKFSITHIYPIKHHGEYTLVACSIKAGKTHQIRAVCAHYKHPILGDTLYGSKQKNSQYFLHSYLLKDNSLTLPEKTLAPIPSSFNEMLNKLKITDHSLPDHLVQIDKFF